MNLDTSGVPRPAEGGGESDQDRGRRADGTRPPVDRADRLPPPAFPPGQRRDWVHRPRESPTDHAGAEEGTIPDDAFLGPNEPIRRIDDPGEGSGGGAIPTPEATRDDGERQLSDEDIASLLVELAREIRGHEGGRLLWKPGVPPLEGAVRGLLSGYLRLGRREGERP